MLVIPLIVGGLSYIEATKMVREDVIKSNLSSLEQTRDVVDSRLSEVNKIVLQLSLNGDLRHFANLQQPLDTSEYYNLRELIQELSRYKVTGDFISNFFITYKNSGLIISPTTFYEAPFFYDTFFSYDNLKSEEWNKKFVQASRLNNYIPSTKVSFEEDKFSAITYVKTIFAEQSDDTVNVNLFINERDIQGLLKKVSYYKEGWVYIINSKNEIITSVTGRYGKIIPLDIPMENGSGHFQKKISGKIMTVVYANSAQSDWKYIYVVPSKIVMDRVSYIRNITLGVTIAAIFIGFLIALYLSYMKSKPIEEIVQMVSGFFGVSNVDKKDEYEVIKNNFNNIIVKNKDLEEAVQKQIPIIREAFFNSLLKGEYSTDAEAQNIMKQININIIGENFIVLLININGYYVNLNPEVIKELAINRMIVENVTQQNIENGYIHLLDESKLAIILSYESSNKEECSLNVRNLVDRISKHLKQVYNLTVIFGAGDFTSSLLQLVQSYEQAVKVLEYKLMKRDSGELFYNEMPVMGVGYYYPVDVEARIINVVKAGDNETLQNYVKNLYDENFIKRDLSVDMITKLFHDMRDTLYKIIHEGEELKSVEEKVDKIKCSGNPEKVFRSFLIIYEELCSISIRLKKDSENRLINDIMAYIKENYMDINFSTYIVASKFGISEAYFPHFFKSETGDTFSSTLEDIRIEKACELLKTDLSIKDIADKVGYSGDKSFRRAFKRAKGVSPTEFAGR